jgi:hypothetical protein
MPDAGAPLRVFCVELAVEGTAVVTVYATSSEEAGELAEADARPVDVCELDDVSVERVVEVEPVGRELTKARRGVARARAPKRSERAGQA